MGGDYLNLTAENLAAEHLCCAIADKKHQAGVAMKKAWLAERQQEGHVFRKLDAQGKIFIEYAPLELAWAPVLGENYLYIYCLWVSGSFKGQGHGRALLEYCIADARAQGKSGLCLISSQKKKPFLAERKFLERFGFIVADRIGEDYLFMALSFDGSLPCFAESAKRQRINQDELTIYYSPQCPYIPDCLEQIAAYCRAEEIPLSLLPVESLAQAKELPCVFNNWAVFYRGRFQTLHLLNEGYLRKMLAGQEKI